MLVEWVEPYDLAADCTLICRMTTDDAILWQKKNAYQLKGYIYETDQQALDDFMVVRWARFVSAPEQDIRQGEH